MATASAYQAFRALPEEERLRRIQAATATPKTPTGMSAQTAQQTATPSMPAFGSNVANFDSNNAQHVQLANAGQQFATAKSTGDTAGMSAARALGDQIRSGVQGASFDSVKGISTLPTAMPQVSMPNQTATPSIMTVASTNDLQREAAANIAKQRAGLEQGVNKFIAGLKSGFDYSRQNTADGRVLQDVTRTQTANPFSNLGRKSFNEGLIGRQRTIEDGATERQFNNELTAVQQQLLDFDRLAPEQQQALFQELKRMERTYGLDLAQISGTLPDGQRTLSGQAQDFAQSPNNPQNAGQLIQNQISQLKLENLPREIELGLDALQQDLDTGRINQQQAEIQLKELQDPQSVTNRSRNIQLQLAELDLKNAPEEARLRKQQLQKTIEQIGKEPSMTDFDKQMQDIKLKTAQAELDALTAGKPKASMSTFDAQKLINGSQFMGKDVDEFGQPITGTEVVKDAAGLGDFIFSLELPEAQTRQLYQLYGLKWGE